MRKKGQDDKLKDIRKGIQAIKIEAEKAEENRRENFDIETQETPPPLELSLKIASNDSEDDKDFISDFISG